MIGQKLQQLSTYILDKSLVTIELLGSAINTAKIELSNKTYGSGIVIGHFNYQSTLTVTSYVNDPTILFAHISAWLQTFDDDRDDLNLLPPTIEIFNPTLTTVDIRVHITFDEEIQLIQDDLGDIPFSGTTWSIAPIVIDEATEVAVGDNQALPTDASYIDPV